MATIEIKTFEKGVEIESRQAVVEDSVVNDIALRQKAAAALNANRTYLGHAAVPAGNLTVAQSSAAIRQLTDQVDALTRQNQALIRLALNLLADISDT